MKIILIWMCSIFLLITACSFSEPEQLVIADDEIAEETGQFVELYKKTMIEAVNTRNFNILEPYLISNNSFYHSLRHYVEELGISGAKKELLTFQVDTVYVDEIGNIYVDVYEEVELFEESGETIIERNVQYELTRGKDETLRVVTIRERK
ncbi:hypothetical protein GN156_01675 [bacterium LRH843]|nr:hypothetical protein [bacterium LRH843]